MARGGAGWARGHNRRNVLTNRDWRLLHVAKEYMDGSGATAVVLVRKARSTTVRVQPPKRCPNLDVQALDCARIQLIRGGRGALDWQKFDPGWARKPAATAARELIIMRLLGPIVEHYTHPVTLGKEVLDGLKPPVIFAANHSSHLDTPTILRSFPKEWRSRIATIAAADYFYKNRVVASLVTLSFATVPIERKGGLSKRTTDRLALLLKEGWSLLVYPEGTRSRDGKLAQMRSGAAFIAVENAIPVVPVSVMGTYRSMPVGRPWPAKHPVVVHLGSALYPQPGEDHKALTARLQATLERMRRDSSPLEES